MTEHTSDQGQFKAILVYKAALGPTICGEPCKAGLSSACVKHLLHLSSYFASYANQFRTLLATQKIPRSSSQRIQKYLKLTTAVTVAQWIIPLTGLQTNSFKFKFTELHPSLASCLTSALHFQLCDDPPCMNLKYIPTVTKYNFILYF